MPAEGSAASSPIAFSHRETLVILAGLMLGMFLAALDQTIVAVALPRISADLHGVSHLSWVITSYLLTSTAVTPIYGKLSDLYGRKPLLQVAIALFIVTSVLCAFARTMPQLIVFRALQGLGGGGLISMAHATIADVLSPRERGRYQGYIAGVWGVAAVSGPVLGGLFVDYLSWRWVFWINIPLGIGALVMSELTLGRLRAKRLRHRIDYAGAVLIVSAVCCLLLVTTMGGEEVPWTSPIIGGLLAGAAVLFALCVLQEIRAPEPILPPRLFRNSVFVCANITSMMAALSVVGCIIFLPLFLQLVFRLPAGESGLMLIPLMLSNMVGAIMAGRLIARIGRYRRFPIIGMAASTVASILVAFAGPGTPLAVLGAETALLGFGTGFIGPAVLVSVQNAIAPYDLGAGTASINFFRNMGGAFGAALFGALLLGRLGSLLSTLPGHEMLGPEPAAALIHAGAQALDLASPALAEGVRQAATGAFGDVFLLAAAIFFLGFLGALFLKELPLETMSGLARNEALAQAL